MFLLSFLTMGLFCSEFQRKIFNCIKTLLFVKKSTFKSKRLCYIPCFIVSLWVYSRIWNATALPWNVLAFCPQLPALLAFSANYLYLIAIVDESKHTNKFSQLLPWFPKQVFQTLFLIHINGNSNNSHSSNSVKK